MTASRTAGEGGAHADQHRVLGLRWARVDVSGRPRREEHGLDGVWTAEHLGFHDAMVPSAMYLRATQRIEIGMVGFSPVSRHPAVLAMELGSMSELAPGRVRVQVGTGDSTLVAKLGREVPKPIGATRAFVQSLRETMAGRDMKVAYPEFAFDGFRMMPLGPVPPIDVMAIRPKMLKLAAQLGDGLSLSAGARSSTCATPSRIERELAAAGRDRRAFRITAIVITAIGDDLDTIRAPLAPMLSTFPQETAGYLARGLVDADALVAAEKEGGTFARHEDVDARPDRPDRARHPARRSRRRSRSLRSHRDRRDRADDAEHARTAARADQAARRSPTARGSDPMTDTATRNDEATVMELHNGFVEANTTGHHPFLEAHMYPGPDRLIWYNLNQSNYYGVDHIVELWKMLTAISPPGAKAVCVPRDERVDVIGDAALVTYLMHFEADFGALGKFAQDARSHRGVAEGRR